MKYDYNEKDWRKYDYNDYNEKYHVEIFQKDILRNTGPDDVINTLVDVQVENIDSAINLELQVFL